MTSPTSDASPDYRELVLFVVRKLVSRPDAVEVGITRDGNRVDISVKTAPEDLGKLIGRDGRHISALRMVVRSASLRPRDRVRLEVRD